MARKRLIINGFFVLLLPLAVAVFGFGVATTALLVAGMLLWRWLIVLSGIWAPEKTPAVVLESISASHYVEKVRWCLDRLGVDYTERQHAGTLGVFFTGRTVPQLRLRTGMVQSVIGNSPEILRYLWGAYGGRADFDANFLAPTEERVELERRLDAYGRSLQVWVYYHMLDDRALTLQAWGANSPCVPSWQKALLKVLFPLQATMIRRAFRVSDEHYEKSVLRIEELLADVDTRLADGRASILGDADINYTDLAFAALSGLWLQPPGYGGVKGKYVRIDRTRVPRRMRADIERWLEDFPRASGFVEALYRDQRESKEA
jgi:glutathione S-transferase